MVAKRIVVIMLLAIAFFILAASGTSFAFIGWIVGFLLLGLALTLLTGERGIMRME
jgi:hypothetical protein